MRSKLFQLIVLAAALVLITSSPGQPQSSVTIDIQNFAFSPASITIPVGTTITWTNKDSTPHTVTGRNGAFNSGSLGRGQTFQFTFNTPGTFDYFCSIHPSMTATVIVTREEQVQEFSLIHSLKDLKIYPATLTVKKGVKVRLFNTATDGSHPTISISSDEAGQKPLFNVQPFDVEVGQLTVVEFTPDQAGTFFITHKLHGHNIEGTLIVQP